MNLRTVQIQITALAVVAGWTAAAQIVEKSDQLEFPEITVQPVDQDVPLKGNVVISVQATNADAYIWLHNGVLMDGQTNSSLTLANVGLDDVGLYTCYVVKGTEAVPTRTASLDVFTPLTGGQFFVYGTPVLGSGSQGTCPGTYSGYVNYTKSVSQGWGWAPSTNTSTHTAADGTGRTDTKVQYGGKYGDTGCDQTIVTIPDPTVSPKYRFTIFFTNNVPTNAYPIILSGFNP